MTNHTAIWDALAKTDPAHTKPFNRAGGFKGTAIKPIWIVKKLTEQFGPCGVGWGLFEPTFQVVPCDGEILVFCTASGWHGDRANVLWGVGGDKVMAKRSSGAFCDDEAFKKAFTDAVGNAFKFLGVSADVHMGLFDDDKYVTAAREEFREQPAQAAKPKGPITDDQRDTIATMAQGVGVDLQVICDHYGINNLKQLTADKYEDVIGNLRATQPRQKVAA
jgi:hypothetical protein